MTAKDATGTAGFMTPPPSLVLVQGLRISYSCDTLDLHTQISFVPPVRCNQ